MPDEARVEVTGPASELIYVIVSKEFQRGVDEEGEPVTTVFTQDATLNDASLEYSRIF
ncbi:MAG: hypothetical protein GWM90_11970 [Gemmatimonadetes bacterium]|nr:hypothetical protein [Gemmatimonadota bacterium]NIQ60192.1 hypothetical protein [Gemmatimonadota bacterium]NIU52646.1 hypothetical protein [Gemmatimonadota bacterium]NIW36443.1 hypothetical protein [Gemmatimonadota bacterium]NIX44805.1 hypothetical protein [Gemmatimonadota bacterium]